METILIKPHHFMDIIKLYGTGIHNFVPDEKMGHDFYKVANTIIHNPDVTLRLTIYGDDICKPCKKYHDICIDALHHIPGCTSKDIYNQTLDTRIISLYSLSKETYTAKELCDILSQSNQNIFDVYTDNLFVNFTIHIAEKTATIISVIGIVNHMKSACKIGNRYIKTPLITSPLATDTIKEAFGFNSAWK